MKENYISLRILDKNMQVKHIKPDVCEHLSSHALECNVGGFAHLECANPSFHEKCPFKFKHMEIIQIRNAKNRKTKTRRKTKARRKLKKG